MSKQILVFGCHQQWVMTLYWLGWTGLLSNYVSHRCSKNGRENWQPELHGGCYTSFPVREVRISLLINHRNMGHRTDRAHFVTRRFAAVQWHTGRGGTPAPQAPWLLSSLKFSFPSFWGPGHRLEPEKVFPTGIKEEHFNNENLKIFIWVWWNNLSQPQWR